METTPTIIDDKTTVISELNLESLTPGSVSRFWMHLVTDGIGQPVYVPIMVAKGSKPGKTVGITAAVHGNELNGIPIIQRLFKELDPNTLSGTLIGVPVVNIPSLLRRQRRFIDGIDLNHIMPGKPDGNVSEVYAYRLIEEIVGNFEYLVDLHTASFGRVNSYYIRADLSDPVTNQMALLQNAQIIVDNPPYDGTLRGAVADKGIHAITLEVGDPNTFQRGVIRSGLTGIYNLLVQLGMFVGHIEEPETPPVICHSSYWIYTDTGGVLTVHPRVTERITKGQVIATMRNIFGDLVREYLAPEDGIVIGKSTSPVNQTGGRILHLGLIREMPEMG